MLLDDQRLLCQGEDVRLIEREALPVLGGDLDGAHALFCAGGAVNHLDRLVADVLAQHRAAPGAKRRLVDVELIRIDGALHHGLAETVRGGDEDHVAKARVRVEREHDAGRPQVAAHHVLYADRQRDGAVIELVVDTVGNCAVIEQRGIHFVNAALEVLLAPHVQKGLLLTGEGGFRQILRGRRRAYGDGELVTLAHFAPGGENLLVQPCREGRGEHPASNLFSDDGKSVDVIHVERGENGANSLIQTALRQEIPIRVRSGGKAAGHRYPEIRKPRDHFTDRGILPSDQLDILVL